LNRYVEAERALKKAIELIPSPKRRFAHIYLGHVFKQKGDFAQAARWYRKVIVAAPRDTDGFIYLGVLLADQGRFREAEKVLRAATRCNEGCIDEAFMNLGNALRAQERFEEAAECMREAIRLDPNYKVAKNALRDVESCLKSLNRG
jgi:tetratricopeptide (TPR) repeat protein